MDLHIYYRVHSSHANVLQADPAGKYCVTTALERAVDAVEPATLTDGERHTEYFLDIFSCA
jgi:hypothetical protein